MENTVKPVDLEWVELIAAARRIGLTIEEIREFLRDPNRHNNGAGERARSHP